MGKVSLIIDTILMSHQIIDMIDIIYLIWSFRIGWIGETGIGVRWGIGWGRVARRYTAIAAPALRGYLPSPLLLSFLS
jgi:hypothetical protein